MGSQSPCPPPLSLRLTDADFLGELYRFNSVLVKRCNFVAGDTGGASSSSSSFSSQLPEVVMRLVRTNIDFGARPRVYRDARTGEPVLLQCCCGQNPCGFEALCGCPIPEQCIWPPFMHTKEACDPPAASLPVPQEQANGVKWSSTLPLLSELRAFNAPFPRWSAYAISLDALRRTDHKLVDVALSDSATVPSLPATEG
jgi:hypothetical protein